MNGDQAQLRCQREWQEQRPAWAKGSLPGPVFGNDARAHRRCWATAKRAGRCPVNRRPVAAVAIMACVGSLAACRSTVSESRPVDLGRLTSSSLPYYYVGRSFDGLQLTHAESYHSGVANLIYGTCEPRPDGCPPPLALQHRLCRGRATVVIFVGVNPKPGRAARAAKALRPLSKGARRMAPEIAFDRSPPC